MKLKAMLGMLVVALLVALFAVPASAALTGTGVEADPYVVTTAAELTEALAQGGYISVTQNIDAGNVRFTIEKDVTITGVGDVSIITTNDKLFEVVQGSATVSDFNVVNVNNLTLKAGKRCIDTRSEYIELNLTGVEMSITKNGNNNPLALGGSDTDTTSKVKATLDGCEIVAENSNYAFIVWVPADITIKDSSLTGYAALYMKGTGGGVTTGSVVNVINSTLTGVNNSPDHVSNSFAAVVLEDEGATVNFKAGTQVIGEGSNVNGVFAVGLKVAGNTVNVEEGATLTLLPEASDAHVGLIGGTEFLPNSTLNVDPSNTALIEDIKAEGLDVSSTGTVLGVPVAIANGINYYTLEDALAAGGTIKLVKDLVLETGITVSNTLVLDLNGKTISMADASGAACSMITVASTGNLTINDSVGTGKLSFGTTTPGGQSYASNTISNHGILVVNGGWIENTSASGVACYALDCYAGSTTTINGGKFTARSTTVRIFNWSDNLAKLTINGGEIISEVGYAVNLNMGNTTDVELNINGGTLTTNDTNYGLAVYVWMQDGTGYSAEDVKVSVAGGTLNGSLAFNGKTSTTMTEGNVSVSGGSMDSVICYGTPTHAFISGGVFEDTTGMQDYVVSNAELDGSGRIAYAPYIVGSPYGSYIVNPAKPAVGSVVTVTVKENAGYDLNVLTVAGPDNRPLLLTAKGNGVFTYVQPIGKVTVSATFTAEGCDGKDPSKCPTLKFTDVKLAWMHKPVDYVVSHGLMGEEGSTLFKPDEILTRAMMMQVMYNLEGKPAVTTSAGFTDVPADASYADAVNWAASINLTAGKSDVLFDPNGVVTRQEIACFLYRYAQYKGVNVSVKGSLANYTDGDTTASWAKTAMEWALGNTLFSGYPDGSLKPTNSATRVEVAQVAMCYCQNILGK
ncbi:MAG: S-layer homology domain-containing protein [Clostridia bacterium]|nr:S-layer homology domain-containing protein [Clostridia bacterium]